MAEKDEIDIETISFDEVETNKNDDSNYNENDWSDSYDDFDSEAWEKHYGQESEDLKDDSDPWDLE